MRKGGKFLRRKKGKWKNVIEGVRDRMVIRRFEVGMRFKWEVCDKRILIEVIRGEDWRILYFYLL